MQDIDSSSGTAAAFVEAVVADPESELKDVAESLCRKHCSPEDILLPFGNYL